MYGQLIKDCMLFELWFCYMQNRGVGVLVLIFEYIYVRCGIEVSSILVYIVSYKSVYVPFAAALTVCRILVLFLESKKIVKRHSKTELNKEV